MKVGIVTDIHYCSADVVIGYRYPQKALERLKAAVAAFRTSGAVRIICLGDLTDTDPVPDREEINAKIAADVLHSAGIPVSCIMGNHDSNVMTRSEFARVTGFEIAPAVYGNHDVCLHLLDCNYGRDSRPYRVGQVDWTDTYLPEPALADLAQSLSDGRRHWILLHQCIDPMLECHHLLANAAAVREVLTRGKAAGVIEGHYHGGHTSVLAGIPYITLPALCESGEGWSLLDL